MIKDGQPIIRLDVLNDKVLGETRCNSIQLSQVKEVSTNTSDHWTSD